MKLWLGALAAAIAAPGAAQAPKPLFASSDTIHIVIQAPLQTLIRNRSIDSPISGTLTEASGVALPINLTLRGHLNRSSDACEFPPLRVDFTAPPPPTSVFAGQKSLKLMTHCKNAVSDQQYVLLDYAAYRMYNILTPHSFRARLLEVDYRDAAGKPIVSRVAFFLEELKDVAKRNGLQQVRAATRIPVEWLVPTDAARSALFEHMVANHDWSMRAGPAGESCCHNFKLLGVGAPAMTVAIPYDFDFSGFVNEPYATPPEALPIPNVRQRVYRGYCMHNAEVIAAARQFRDARPQLIAAITSTPGLDPRTQQRAIAFLDPFFADIATDQSTSARVLNRCVS
jgi:hypothetical protein